MRRLLFAGLLGVLTACLRPGPALAVDPASGPGCLGVTAEQCVRWLRATMTLDEALLADAMAHRHQVDVNGRPRGGGIVTVTGRLPGHPDQFVILLHLQPDDTVRKVESSLVSNLLETSTETGYDDSRLFAIVSRLLGRRCPGLARLHLYRFFENTMKPRVTQQREDFGGGLNSLHRLHSRAAGAQYCGITFGYYSLVEWRGPRDIRAALNVKRYSTIDLQ